MVAVRNQTSPGTSVTTAAAIVLTWATNPTAGSKVIISMVDNGSSVITSVVDNGTTPTTFTKDFVFNGGGGDILYYRADNITLPASGSYKVTITPSTTVTVNAVGSSYTGVATGAPSSSNHNTGTGTAVTAGSLTPPAVGSLVLAQFATDSGLNPETIGAPGPSPAAVIYKNTNGTLTTGASADSIVTAVTAVNVAWTLGDGPDWGAAAVVYAPASGTVHNASATFTLGMTYGAAPSARTRSAALALGPAFSAAPLVAVPATAALALGPTFSAVPSSLMRSASVNLGLTYGITTHKPVQPASAAYTVSIAYGASPRYTHNRTAALTVGLSYSAVPSARTRSAALTLGIAYGALGAQQATAALTLGLTYATTRLQNHGRFAPLNLGITYGTTTTSGSFENAALPLVITYSGVGVDTNPTPPPPSVAASGLIEAPIRDDFLTSVLSPVWSSSGTATPGSNQLLLSASSAGSSVFSVSQFDWTDSYSICKLTPYTGGTGPYAFMSLVNGSGVNEVDFGYLSGNLVFRTAIAGVKVTTTIAAYSATAHAWLRMRYDITNIYYETSPDGLVWTLRGTFGYVAAGLSIWRMNMLLAAGVTSGTAGNATFQYVNCNASLAGPITQVAVNDTSVWTSNIAVPNVGPHSVVPANVDGNLLVVYAAWNSEALTALIPTPAGAVADDQGNWYRYAGDTGQTQTGIRAGIWICSNAIAVRNWLSFCPQGYTGSFAFQVQELTGLPASYYPDLDIQVSATGTSPLVGYTSHADYVFTLAAVQSATYSLSGPGSQWTAVRTTTSGGTSSDTSIKLSTAWGIYAGNTQVSSAWTGSYPVSEIVMLTVGITVNSDNVASAQSRPSFPRVLVEGAFGSFPGDNTQAILDTTWQDMSVYCIGKQGETAISATRGQQYELATPEAGQLSINCNNQAGDFDPQWAGSVFYSNAINDDMAMQLTGTAGWVFPTSGNNIKAAMSKAFPFASGLGCMANTSMAVTPDTAHTTTTLLYQISSMVNPNGSYTGSLWVYFPAGYSGGVKCSLIATSPAGSTTIGSNTYATVAAGTWTQLQATGAPGLVEDGTTLSVQLDVLSSPAAVFYVAEVAAVAGLAPVLTGLVRLSLPIRVSCFWNGRRYPIGFGYVERYPQDWPDMPQWGWSKITATDVVGVASSVNLPSAVQGEINVDHPYLCFPFAEQYTANTSGAATTASFTGVDGMFAVNTSQVNQRAATYVAGNSVEVVTGQSVGLLGDSGTGMGNSQDTTPSAGPSNGPGAIYGPDLNMTTGQYVVEFWVNSPTPSSPFTVQSDSKLLDIVCQQDLTSKSIGNGVVATVGITTFVSAANPFLWIRTNSTAYTNIGYLIPNLIPAGGATFAVPASLVTVTVANNLINVSVNGLTYVANVPFNAPLSAPIAFVFGQAQYTTGLLYATYAFGMSYATMFPFRIPEFRTWSHAQSGLTGFLGDGVTDRALRYVSWANLNLGLAGQQDTLSALGPAYSTEGQNLATAISSDCTSFGARWGGTANGNLVILSRAAQYNQSTPMVFGDAPAGPLNANPSFNSGLSGWLTSGCTGTPVPTSFSGSTSAQLTFSGGHTNPSLIGSILPVTTGTLYEATLWSQAVGAFNWQAGLSAAVSWYAGSTFLSTTSINVYPENDVWTPAVLRATAPPTATMAIFYVQVNGTPPAGPVILIDQLTARLAYDQVPYEPTQGFDYDNSYVNNEVIATLAEGPITAANPSVRDAASVAKYFQRGPQQVSLTGTSAGAAYDAANWNLQRYKEPSMRVRAISAAPSATPNSFTRILQNDIADPVQVRRSPLNQTSYSLNVITQKVEHVIGSGTWISNYQLSPYLANNAVLQADVAGFDNIGNNTLAW